MKTVARYTLRTIASGSRGNDSFIAASGEIMEATHDGEKIAIWHYTNPHTPPTDERIEQVHLGAVDEIAGLLRDGRVDVAKCRAGQHYICDVVLS
jgi:hypothetical protein